MTQRGKIEKEYIERSKFIIGRTDWDFAHAKAINPLIQYFFCNETLRPSFINTNGILTYVNPILYLLVKDINQ